MKSDFEKTRFIVEHHVIEHSGNELHELINDTDLIEEKRKNKGMVVPMGNGNATMTMVCPVCSAGKCNSKHVTHHFMKELLEAVASFQDPLTCPNCDYRAPNAE